MWEWDGNEWDQTDTDCESPCVPDWPEAGGTFSGQTTGTCCVDPPVCDCGYLRWAWDGAEWVDDGAFSCDAGCIGEVPEGAGSYIGEKRYACCVPDGGGGGNCCNFGDTGWPSTISATIAGTGDCIGSVTLNRVDPGGGGAVYYEGSLPLADELACDTSPPDPPSHAINYRLYCEGGQMYFTGTVVNGDLDSICQISTTAAGDCCPNNLFITGEFSPITEIVCTSCCGGSLPTTFEITGERQCCECVDIGEDITITISGGGGYEDPMTMEFIPACLAGETYHWEEHTEMGGVGLLCFQWNHAPHTFINCGETAGQFSLHCIGGQWQVYVGCGGFGNHSVEVTGTYSPLNLTGTLELVGCAGTEPYVVTVTGPGPGSMPMTMAARAARRGSPRRTGPPAWVAATLRARRVSRRIRRGVTPRVPLY